LIFTEVKTATYLLCKETEFVIQIFGKFVKMALTRVSRHRLWLETSGGIW